MAFCGNCNTQVQDGTPACPSCGAPIGVNAQPQVGGSDVETNKLYAILAYLGFLVLVPILAAPKSPFARFHANQGLVLFIAEVVYGIVYSILAVILAFIPIIGWLLIMVLGLLFIAFPVFAILGIINAVGGKAQELPIIGKIRILK